MFNGVAAGDDDTVVDVDGVAGDAKDSADPGGRKRLQHPLSRTHWLRQVFLDHHHQDFDQYYQKQESRR